MPEGLYKSDRPESGDPAPDRVHRLLAGAVLDPKGAADCVVLTRHLPAVPLRAFVRHYWFVRWDLADRGPHSQSTLPLPAVNAVIEAAGSRVFGICSRRFDKVLQGRGAAYGILFRSAGFAPFYAGSLSELVDGSVPFTEAFGSDAHEFRRLCSETEDSAPLVAALDQFLTHAPRRPSKDAEKVQAWVDLIEADPELSRVEQLSERTGVDLRTLQRNLRQYVGIPPKALIRRYRLLEAAGRIVRGEFVNFAQLSGALGYTDQPHFIRDFHAVVGVSPARYAKTQRAEP